MKLNLGYCDIKIEGYVNVDIDESIKPDLVDDITKLTKIDDNSVDEIRAHNVLEHIPQIDIERTLKLWFNKLKRGGKLDVLVPNLKAFCILYLMGYIKEPWAFSALYSSHKSRNPVNWHSSGFSFSYLTKILKRIGFENIEIIASPYFSSELRLIVTK